MLLNVSIITTVQVVVDVLTKEKFFKTMKEDMKYENPFHRLQLEKKTFDVKIEVISIENRLDFRRLLGL